MKNYKTLLNQAVNNSSLHKITDEESVALKKCVLAIYDDVSHICEENGLVMFMGGGSCLGAVRHKGFIPWDDDLDVNMPRPDYDKLISLLEAGVLGDNYEFVYPHKEKDSPCLWLQIYRKDTRLITVDGERTNYPNGCYIDVFPIEGVPVNKWHRRLKGWVSNGIRLIANMVMDAESPLNPELKKLYESDKSLNRMINIRRLLGRLFSIISHQKWVCWFDSHARNNDMSGWVGIPTGRGLYYNESHPSSVFFPPKEGDFEGRKVLLPANYDAYLKALYGDYMCIPPEDKRESHFVKELDLPQKFYSKVDQK